MQAVFDLAKTCDVTLVDTKAYFEYTPGRFRQWSEVDLYGGIKEVKIQERLEGYTNRMRRCAKSGQDLRTQRTMAWRV